MKIAVGCDHRGFELKEKIKVIVTELGHECSISVPIATNQLIIRIQLMQRLNAVATKQADRAILACASGIGMSMAANKVDGIRAALCHDELTAQASRGHNDSNILCLPADQISESLLRKMVEVWLKTDFLGGRHQRRVNKIQAIEEGKDPREITN